VAQLREQLAAKMTATQVAQAQMAARKWTPIEDR
jgi:hypothetical protein